MGLDMADWLAGFYSQVGAAQSSRFLNGWVARDSNQTAITASSSTQMEITASLPELVDGVLERHLAAMSIANNSIEGVCTTDAVEEGVVGLELSSVLKKRRRKVNKHKQRKRRKATRIQRQRG